jgi:prepilin-type N-terminal cleavage/methylation domain-containing protein
MKTTMSKRSRSGMTLIELIAAILLTSLMSLAGTAAFTSIVDHRDVIRTATVDVERAAAMREMLRTWIVSGTIQLQLGGGPRGQNQAANRAVRRPLLGVTAAVTDGDELTFTTTAPTPTLSFSTRVRLFIDTDENTPEQGLAIEYQYNTAMPLQRLELDSTIKVMTVEILDRRTNRWFPSKEAATVQPLAVRLTFSPPEGETMPDLLQLPFVFRIGDPAQPMVGR